MLFLSWCPLMCKIQHKLLEENFVNGEFRMLGHVSRAEEFEVAKVAGTEVLKLEMASLIKKSCFLRKLQESAVEKPNMSNEDNRRRTNSKFSAISTPSSPTAATQVQNESPHSSRIPLRSWQTSPHLSSSIFSRLSHQQIKSFVILRLVPFIKQR